MERRHANSCFVCCTNTKVLFFPAWHSSDNDYEVYDVVGACKYENSLLIVNENWHKMYQNAL